jgi:hypothetical protein
MGNDQGDPFSLKPGNLSVKTGQKTGHLEKRFIQQKSLKIYNF